MLEGRVFVFDLRVTLLAAVLPAASPREASLKNLEESVIVILCNRILQIIFALGKKMQSVAYQNHRFIAKG